MGSTNSETCFVISPFGEPYDTYFIHIIKPAIESCDLYAVRGDSLYRPTTIVDDIWQGIREAKILVAELTDRNPNVFYELGLAHAVSKPVILISKSIDDVPFDLRSIRVLLYDKDHPEWGNKLKLNLTRALKEVIQSPTSAIPTTFKQPVKVNTPEEPETLLRLENLEAMVRRLADDLGNPPWDFSSSEPAEPAPKQFPRPHLAIGQRVMHKKFGKGTVVQLEGHGDDERAHINFDKAGAKWLALAVARIDPLPGASA
jgi:hypothetical protein